MLGRNKEGSIKMKKDTNVITLEPIKIQFATISIEGDGDIVLNKMNARTERELIKKQSGEKVLPEVPNIWEDIITSVHWLDGIPVKDTYTDCNEQLLVKLLRENAPCITGFGLKKSFLSSVTRNEIDTFSTKIDNAVNVVPALVPIKFSAHYVDEKILPNKNKTKGPILARLNRFSGWSAEIPISYTENVYKLEQIVNIINLAGFGLGIGSGRSSGYGRYHVTGIK